MHPSLWSALSCALVLAATACRPASPPPVAVAQDQAQAAQAAPTPQWRVSDWRLPAAGAAAQPDLIAAPDGGWLLSWIEPGARGGHALKFARAGRDGAWGPIRTIAQGRDWFVNWADTPHIALAADGALWAHWLRKSAPATYAYDVVLSRSGDGGATWSEPAKVNDDGTATEHGFVSLWPDGADGIGVAWLDGRRTGGGEGHEGGAHAGHRGAMTLRAASFDARSQRSLDSELDPMTCDCCQTDAAPTARGPLLVYRDRDAQEIRDIAATRREAGGWTAPRHVHADRWTMPACPVNGPSVAARGDDAIVAWYTAVGGESKVQAARSGDAGTTFGAPVVLDRGEPVQGRVEAALGADAAWVLWLRENRQDGQTLWLARLAPDLSRELQRVQVARLQGRGRGTGFPQLAAGDGAVYIVWTELADGAARLRGARLQPEATVSSSGESNIEAGETTGSSSGTRAP
ncbi:BNR repeat [Lysobacter enzymogenes]|uniref:BNR repeat n=1 Tax=Lysobacter enzymogenes TaxID=69 RepID=A0A0S2DA92_LYSEN|nr:sialidase family protein [Lysobacter enzymogenes]ALN55445.1 BNR repeat [Lysobacter enzymogenes]